MPVAEGDVVVGLRGRYRIESRHGEGSFGVTYRARDAASGAEVIVKELRVEKLDDWKALELFEREGEVLATLSHPNIPAFRDFFAHGAPAPLPVSAMSTYDGPAHLSLVLVQQFITGSTLQQRVDLGQRLSASEGLGVLRALLGALHYLHERTPPLVHRDIKPGNVILTPEGRPFLVDFGAIQNRLTGPGATGSTIVGTVGYMPLEQIRGDARPASDLYALGVTMVVALSATPLEGVPFDDAAGKIATERALPRDVPQLLRHALDSMIAPLLGQRARSAAEVLSRLDSMPSQDAIEPGTPATFPSARRWVYAVLAIAMAVLLGGVVVGLTARAPATSVITPRAAPPPGGLPFAAGQTWSGTYICAQGSTSLVLHIVATSQRHVDAIFEFNYLPKHVHGSNKASGTFDPTTREFDLLPGTWIEQPVNYVTVILHGRVTEDGRTYSGTISGPSCTTFSVNRDGP
jgi:serine/threonine protein kinase